MMRTNSVIITFILLINLLILDSCDSTVHPNDNSDSKTNEFKSSDSFYLQRALNLDKIEEVKNVMQRSKRFRLYIVNSSICLTCAKSQFVLMDSEMHEDTLQVFVLYITDNDNDNNVEIANSFLHIQKRQTTKIDSKSATALGLEFPTIVKYIIDDKKAISYNLFLNESVVESK